MFLIKKFLQDTNKEHLRRYRENFNEESNTPKAKSNVKKTSRRKSKKVVNPVLAFNDGRLMNYKQNLHHRITLKKCIFPNAIQTNILSRVKGANHFQKFSPEPEITPFISKHMFASKHRDKNKLTHEGNIKSPTPTMLNQNSPSMVASVCAVSHWHTPSSKMFNAYTISRSVDSIHPNRLCETIQMKKQKREIEKQRLQFIMYSKEEAQSNLMYKELAQVINKTMIIQNVTYFEDVPDPMEVLHDKLWILRNSRDESYENSLESEDNDACCFTRMPMHVEKSPDLLAKNSGNKELRECRRESSQENIQQFPREGKTSSFEEKRFLNCVRKNINRKDTDRIGRNCFLRGNKKPDGKDNLGHMRIQDDQTDLNINRSSEEYSRKSHARKMPSKTGNSRRNSVFNSTLISTERLEDNMTLNPIKFLENVSNDSGSERKRRNLSVSEMNVYEDILSYASPAFGKNVEIVNNGLNEKLVATSHNTYQNEFSSVGEHESYFPDFKLFHRTDNSNVIAPQYNFNKSVMESNSSQNHTFDSNRSQDLELFLLPKVAKKTPEMKYYPCRLY